MERNYVTVTLWPWLDPPLATAAMRRAGLGYLRAGTSRFFQVLCFKGFLKPKIWKVQNLVF